MKARGAIRIVDSRPPRSAPLRLFPSSAKPVPFPAAPPHRRAVVRLASGREAAIRNRRRVFAIFGRRDRDNFLRIAEPGVG